MLARFSNAAACRPPSASPYEALCRKSLERSPISRPGNDSADTPLSMTRSVSRTAILDTIPDQGRHQTRQEGQKEGMVTPERIHDQPYCTRQCLFGLILGRAIDKTCPNTHSHGPRHISQSEFLRLLRVQLAEERGPDAGAMPLYRSEGYGSLFKLRLSAYGYTLLAKGVEAVRLQSLQNGSKMY